MRKKLRAAAKKFGAVVEKACDGKFNYFTHPNNCAFGAPLPQSTGDFKSKKSAFLAAGINLKRRNLI